MTTSVYPNQLDTNLELPKADPGVTEINGDVVNALRDAVIAIESTVGVNPQGNTASVSNRLSQSLDVNGNIKSSALDGIGLVTLPITNAQVSDDALIEEAKLKLDYTTAFLKARIESVATDTDAVSATVDALVIDILKHYTGELNRHDGYQIDLDEDIMSASDVETAMHLINNFVLDLSATVDDILVAIAALELRVDALEAAGDLVGVHQDIVHTNAVVLQDRGTTGDQGSLATATLATTIFETEVSLASNAVQVMRPNVARITGKTPELATMGFGLADQLRVQAGGVGRDPLDIDLGSLVPATDLNDVVAAINTAARLAANHYPISAYNVAGRLVLAHNLPGEQYTVQVLDTISDSAHASLGFSEIVNTEISWADGYHAANIGGKTITDMRPLLRIRYDHSSGALDEIYPAVGDLLTLFDIDTGAEARIICNIHDHDDPDAYVDGTYYITSIIGSGNIGFTLNEDIPYGEFNIDIAADAINFESGATSRGELYDIFVESISEDGYDGYGRVTKSLRAEYLTNAGVVIRGLSKDFPTDNMTWQITTNDTIQILENGLAGTAVDIPTNFRGQLKVYAADNINSGLFEVIGSPSPASEKAISPINSFDSGPDKLYIASVHYAGDYGDNELKFVTDRRVLSDTINDTHLDIQDSGPTDDALGELRNNGVIRGFDVISSTTTTIKVRGGRAIVNGKIVDVATQDVTIDRFTSDVRLLTLDYDGVYKTFDSDEAGFSMAELTAGDAYGDDNRIVPLVEFGTTATELDGVFTDKRLIVANIDKQLLDLKSSVDGQIAQLEGALSGSLIGMTNAASTAFIPTYISVSLVSSNTAQAGLFNPFNTDTYGGAGSTNASANMSFAASTGRFTAGHSGTYTVALSAYYSHSVSALLDTFEILKNGTTTIWDGYGFSNATADPVERSATFIYDLSAGDYLELKVNSNGANTAQCESGTTLTIVKIDADDEVVSEITSTANLGFDNLDDIGFVSGTDTTRRFSLTSLHRESLFKARGITHINIMLEAVYTDVSGTDPFGTSGDVDIDVGAVITTGRLGATTTEQYVTVKSVNSSFLPANSITEQYVASIPLSAFNNIQENIIFDITPRVRIAGSLFVDGGTGGGSIPKITFDRFRIVTSSYSISGDILEQDGTSTSLATTVSDNL